jgi:nuclear cap-binding protein subunit 1
LLKLLFKSFVDVLTERLPPVSVDGEIPNLRSGDQNVNFAAQNSEAATMEIDNENGADNNRSV